MTSPGGIMTVFGGFLRHAGWLLTLAGLVLPAMQLYDALTCSPAIATVTAVQTHCTARACKACARLPVRCDSPGLPAEAGLVERANRVRLSFDTRYGVRTATASFGKLNLSRASAGDELSIRYRRSNPRYVTTPFSFHEVSLGLSITAAGLVLLMLARAVRHASAATGVARSLRSKPVPSNGVRRNAAPAAGGSRGDAPRGSVPYAAGTPCVVQRARGLW